MKACFVRSKAASAADTVRAPFLPSVSHCPLRVSLLLSSLCRSLSAVARHTSTLALQ